VMPSASFTGSPKQLANKYRKCKEICKKLLSQNDLGMIESKTELHILHIRERLIPFQQIQLFFYFSFISSITFFFVTSDKTKEVHIWVKEEESMKSK
jgi:hypothetical protein